MGRHFPAILIAVLTAKASCKDSEPELPPCPANIQFFPQNLPMHCRMPVNVKNVKRSLPDLLSLPMGPNALPFPPPPGIPAPPGIVPPPGIPFPPGMPSPGPFPMPMPMPVPGPSQKLPVIVMPFYSPDPAFKRSLPKRHRKLEIYTRRPRPYSSDESCSDTDTDTSSDTSTDTSSEGRGWWRGYRRSGSNLKPVNKKHKRRHRHAHNKKDLLTPILQYVTKDGYVIYEKKITKNEAKNWLNIQKENNGEDNEQQSRESVDSPNDNIEMIEQEYKQMEQDINPDVEILDGGKDKEQVETQTHKVPRKHHPHKSKLSKVHHAKEQDKSKENTT